MMQLKDIIYIVVNEFLKCKHPFVERFNLNFCHQNIRLGAVFCYFSKLPNTASESHFAVAQIYISACFILKAP